PERGGTEVAVVARGEEEPQFVALDRLPLIDRPRIADDLKLTDHLRPGGRGDGRCRRRTRHGHRRTVRLSIDARRGRRQLTESMARECKWRERRRPRQKSAPTETSSEVRRDSRESGGVFLPVGEGAGIESQRFFLLVDQAKGAVAGWSLLTRGTLAI